MQYYVGCSGWSYTSWQGPFYPTTIENSAWLKYYSHVFDYVETDSSFYRIPTIFMVKNWFKRSPQNFRFTAKFPKIITHDKRLKAVDKELGQFFEAMHPLADKTLALLIQLPPSLHFFEGLERLRDLVPELDTKFRYAVEVVVSARLQVNRGNETGEHSSSQLGGTGLDLFIYFFKSLCLGYFVQAH